MTTSLKRYFSLSVAVVHLEFALVLDEIDSSGPNTSCIPWRHPCTHKRRPSLASAVFHVVYESFPSFLCAFWKEGAF
jgi:hypothetical protein